MPLFINKRTIDRPVLIFAGRLCTIPGDRHLVACFVAVLLGTSTSSYLLFRAQSKDPHSTLYFIHSCVDECVNPVKAACLLVS